MVGCVWKVAGVGVPVYCLWGRIFVKVFLFFVCVFGVHLGFLVFLWCYRLVGFFCVIF